MTDLRKAAEMALEFCDDIGDLGGPYPYVNGTAIVSDSRKVLQELRQALAQPEQEPMAWMCSNEFVRKGCIRISNSKDETWNIPLYTAPPSIEAAVLAEREACAKVCDDRVDAEYATGKVDHNEMAWTQACAEAIRARSEK